MFSPVLRHRYRAFFTDRGGMGAVEFALIVPLLLTILLGASDLALALTINRKAQAVAGAIVDLTSRSSELTSADLTKLFQISTSILAPYPAKPIKIRLVSVNIDDKGTATVDWSCQTVGYSALAKGANYPLPSAMSSVRSRQVLVAEASYPYTPLSLTIFGSSVDVGGTSYVNPRYSNQVVSTGCSSVSL